MAIIRCGNCGRNVSTSAPACPFCAYAPVTPWEQRDSIASFHRNAFRGNRQYVAIVWVVGLIASYPIFGNPAAFLLLPFLPLGLAFPLSQLSLAEMPEAMPAVGLVGGWAVYLVLTGLCLFAQRRRLFYGLLTALSVVLLANAVGCQVMGTVFRDGIH